MKWKRDSRVYNESGVRHSIQKRVDMIPTGDLLNAAESTIYTLGRAIHQGEWDEAELANETIEALLRRLRKL